MEPWFGFVTYMLSQKNMINCSCDIRNAARKKSRRKKEQKMINRSRKIIILILVVLFMILIGCGQRVNRDNVEE